MSVGGHKQFVGQDRVAMVLGGHPETELGLAPDNSGNMIIKDPTTMGPDVNMSDLPFSIRDRAPDYFSQCSTPGLLDPGTVVYASGDLGGKLKITRLAPGAQQDSNMPSNMNLLNMIPDFAEAMKKQLESVKKPPNLSKTTERGATVYKHEEKGAFSHDALKGLPSTGTIFNLLGAKLPQEKQISTAIQQASGLMDGGILSSLGGQIMGMGSMLQSLAGNSQLLSQAMQNMPSDVAAGFSSMMGMMQNVTDSTSSSVVGNRVDPTTMLSNAAKLFGECSSLNDVINATSELASNTHYHGTDKIPKQSFSYSTVYGPTTVTLDAEGNMVQNASPTVILAAVKDTLQTTSFNANPSVLDAIAPIIAQNCTSMTMAINASSAIGAGLGSSTSISAATTLVNGLIPSFGSVGSTSNLSDALSGDFGSAVQKVISENNLGPALGGMLGSSSQLLSSLTGEAPMFGQSAGIFNQMLQRLPSGQMSDFKSTLKNVDGLFKDALKIAHKEGGNIIPKLLKNFGG